MARDAPIVHVVHCIDTEGPLDEDINATFKRVKDLFGLELEASRDNLEALQNRELPIGEIKDKVAAVVAPQLLAYNRTWQDIRLMLDDAMSQQFREKMIDDFNGAWVYTWHCVDHMGLVDNPRRKDYGYGNVFRYYRDAIKCTGSTRDAIAWHFHPLSITRTPLAAATSFANSMEILLYVMARRVIEDRWFPTTNRPGFHAERPDAHAFLEQWIPFDYANQVTTETNPGQADATLGRFGDWRRAPETWCGYHPHHDDYQRPGQCRRWIFRCLNVGTRFRLLTLDHVREAFCQARENGSAILAFADHDYRDLREDVHTMRTMLARVRTEFPDVKCRFASAEDAARSHVSILEPELALPPPRLKLDVDPGRVHVRLCGGSLFGPQPFLALKTRGGNFFHDNLDVVEPGVAWTYVLDDQTIETAALAAVGVGAAGRCGGFDTQVRTLV